MMQDERSVENEKMEAIGLSTAPSNNSQPVNDIIKRIGGEEVLRRIVAEDFFDRLLADSYLSRYYTDERTKNVALLRFHYFEFIVVVLQNGTSPIRCPMLEGEFRRKHARPFSQGMNAGHFERVVKHFRESLVVWGVDPDVAQEAADILSVLKASCRKGHEEYLDENSWNPIRRMQCCKSVGCSPNE